MLLPMPFAVQGLGKLVTHPYIGCLVWGSSTEWFTSNITPIMVHTQIVVLHTTEDVYHWCSE